MSDSIKRVGLEAFIKSITILIVEDDLVALQNLEIILKDMFKSVYTAENGVDGLEVFRKNSPNIVISDIMMPKLNGIGMAKEIKKINSETPIVFLSGFSDKEYLLECIEIGAESYIIKPIAPKNLKESIEKAAKRLYSDIIKKEIEDRELQELILASNTELLKDIAHHWRNPLNVISTNSDLVGELVEDIYSRQEATKALNDDVEDIRSSLSIIQDTVQNLSKVITNFSVVFTQPKLKNSVSLKSVVSDTLIVMEQLCTHDNIDLVVENSEELEIEGEYANLKLAIYEIVKNSIESINKQDCDLKSENNKIELKFYTTNDIFCFECIDSGIGIDSEIFNKINTPYSSTKIKPYGHGLGLFIANRIVKERLDGKLTWKNLERGAKFIITIPLKS